MGAVNAFCVCVEPGDWASEKLSGRVKLEDHSPKWQAFRNVSFQPCKLQNTGPIICMSLNKNGIYCVMPRSIKSSDTCK